MEKVIRTGCKVKPQFKSRCNVQNMVSRIKLGDRDPILIRQPQYFLRKDSTDFEKKVALNIAKASKDPSNYNDTKEKIEKGKAIIDRKLKEKAKKDKEEKRQKEIQEAIEQDRKKRSSETEPHKDK